MIRYRLTERIADLEFKLGRRVTQQEISQATGIGRSTLSKLVSQQGYTTTTNVLEALCRYFKCDIGNLIEYVPD